MVSKTDVEQAFRFILGRDPENGDVVAEMAAHYGSIAQLRRAFIDCPEFAQEQHTAGAGTAPLKATNWDAIPVDVEVSPEDLRAMLRHVEASWEKLGNTELFWSVLTDEKFRASNAEANLDSFYATGEHAAGLLSKAANRAGVTLSKEMTCLELGCGAGRISIWLADRFKQVIACDISNPHLQAAREAATRRGLTNIEFVRTNTVDVLAGLPSFDVFFSLIVLQHNPPPVAALILRTVLNKLNPGGIAYFQIPTYTVGYRFKAGDYLAYVADRQEMEMHCVPQKDLFALFSAAGCDVLEVREDDWTGSPTILSNSFLVRKRG